VRLPCSRFPLNCPKELNPTKTEKSSEVGETSILELDSKGRLTIPKEIRVSLEIARRVLVINAGDHLKLIPLPSDPFRTLHGAFNVKKPFKELRKQAERVGMDEAKERRG